MADAPVFLYVATYGSEADAQADYKAVKALHKDDVVGTYDAVGTVPAARVVNSGTTFPWRNAAGRFPAEVAVPAKREGAMSTVRRHIEVEAPPSVVRAGLVDFEPVDGGGRTTVIFNVDCDEESGPSRAVLEQNVARDLVVFKDYIERGGNQVGKPTMAEKQAMIDDQERHSHEQLHRHIGAEDEPISYQDHFPS